MPNALASFDTLTAMSISS